MEKSVSHKIRHYLKWAMWVVIVQTILVNISASIYAYKFTHFFTRPAPQVTTQNFFDKTWKLFVGPSFYKNTVEPPPPFPYEVVQLQTSDKVAIEGWYSGRDSSEKCVIFFHGLSVNKSYLTREAAMFRLWGYNVMLVDFRGHGRSGGSNCTFGIKETDEVAKAFEYARSRGNQKIILYGVSMGAGVCIRATALKKVHPDAIIADMPFGTLRNHLRSRATILGFPAEPFATLVTFWIGVERGYNGFRHNIAAYAKDITCPVLVEWGERDQYVKRDEIMKVYGNLPAPGKKLVIYPLADHESFLRVDPVVWEHEVISFLQPVVY